VRRPGLLVNAGLGVLALAGALWAYQTVAVSNNTANATANNNTRYATVQTGSVTATVSASGTVQSANTANADFGTSGTVTELDVHVGDTVAKGQVLAKLDPTAAQDQLNTANANLTSAQQSLTRANAANPVDASAVASAQAQVAQAQATVDADQRALDGTVLKAPMAGTVIAVNGSVGGSSTGSSSSASSSGSSGGGGGGGGGGGASAAATSSSASSSGFVQLADLTQLQVSGYFAEADATKLKAGQAATVSWSALAGTRATGKVASIAPTATTQNSVNSYLVVISLDSVPAGARLGQTTSVAVTVAQADNVLRLPTAAVRSAGGRFTVQLVTGTNKTQTTVVQVGVQGDTYYEITGGLQEGQQVAIQRQATPTTSGGPAGGIFGPGGGGGFGGGGGNRGGGGGRVGG
jgi:membrane fusion protein, macrolide-specific efflux system